MPQKVKIISLREEKRNHTKSFEKKCISVKQRWHKYKREIMQKRLNSTLEYIITHIYKSLRIIMGIENSDINCLLTCSQALARLKRARILIFKSKIKRISNQHNLWSHSVIINK